MDIKSNILTNQIKFIKMELEKMGWEDRFDHEPLVSFISLTS
jgi:hypothetical protein